MEIDLSEKAELPAAIVNRNSRQSGNGALLQRCVPIRGLE